MRIIFLDIDEVLNDYFLQLSCEYYFKGTGKKRPLVDEYKVYLLSLIVKSTDSKVVLISIKRGSWANENHRPNYDRFLIDDVFRKYGIFIYDVTHKLGNRGLEIDEWLSCHPEVSSYVILDDGIKQLEKYIDNHLLLIENKNIYEQGLKPWHVNEAIKILKKID